MREIKLKAGVPLPLKDVKQKPFPTWQKPLGLLAKKGGSGVGSLGQDWKQEREMAAVGL